MRTLKTLLKICSMAVAVSGCGLDPYPVTKPKLVDWHKQRYLNHELVDRQNVTFRKTTWSTDMSQLHGDYCITGDEMAELNSWGREAATHCKCQ